MVSAPQLREENVVQHARGFDQFRQRLTIGSGKFGYIHPQLRRLKARDHFLELRKIGDSGSGCKHGNEEQ